IRTAAARDIVCFDAHAAHRLSLPIHRRSAHDAARLEFAASEVAIVEIRHLVVADKNIRLAVPIEVQNDDPESLTLRFDAGGPRDIGEGTVAVVAVESALAAVEFTR